MFVYERFELRYERDVLAETQLCLDSLLESGEAQFFEAAPFGRRER
jgi:hypothetical protein